MVTSPVPGASLDAPISIIGATGSGKTYAAKGVVEVLLEAGRRVCIIDPLGVWHGLRTSADGARPAFPVVIFGGEHADVPISAETAATLAGIIARGEAPAAIIDTSEMTTGESARFLTPFFEALYAQLKTAQHLVLDEADAFAPQNPMPGTERLKGAVDKIARRGRVKGFRLITITQRPAVLDKSVLSQISTLIAMRVTSPQDRKAIEAWVKGNADADLAKDVLDSLSKLQRGEGWIWAPAANLLERVTFPAISTLDTSRTPEHGDAPIGGRARAAVDISAIRAALELPAAPAAVAADRAALVAIGETAAKLEAERERIEQQAFARGFSEGARAGAAAGWNEAVFAMALQASRFRSEPSAEDHEKIAGALLAQGIPASSSVLSDLRDEGLAGAVDPSRAAQPPVSVTSEAGTPLRRRRANSAAAIAEGAIGPAAGKLLGALVRYPHGLGSWIEVCVACGMLHGNGYFYGGRKELLSRGLVEEPEGAVQATEDGIALLGVGDPQSLDDLVGLWTPKLRSPGPQMLQHVARVGSCTKSELAAATGIKPGNGYWHGGIAGIRDNHLVDVVGDRIALAPLLAGASTFPDRG